MAHANISDDSLTWREVPFFEKMTMRGVPWLKRIMQQNANVKLVFVSKMFHQVKPLRYIILTQNKAGKFIECKGT